MNRLPIPVLLGLPCCSVGKESTCNAGDLDSIPGLGRSPAERTGYPLQYSGLENSMVCIVLGVAKSQMWLSDFHSLTCPFWVFDLTYGFLGCNFNHPCSLLITIVWSIFSIHLLSAYMYPENCTYLINLKHHKRK